VTRAVVYVDRAFERSVHIARALSAGLRRHGIEPLERERHTRVEAEYAVAYGWKHHEGLRAHRDAGGHFLYVDLGYWHRKPVGQMYDGYHKVVLDDWCPTLRMRHGCPTDRFDRLGLRVLSGRPPVAGGHIVMAGMSPKSAAHHGFKTDQWELQTIKTLRQHSARRIVFRPKPSDTRAVPLSGASLQRAGTIDSALTGAHLLVTHHSNSAVDAMRLGVPHYCERGVGQLLSIPSLEETERAAVPAPRETRMALLADIAYCQWLPAEMASGECWAYYREMMQ
jgi:hypothetical protein